MPEPLLQIKDLQTHLFTRSGVVRAVDGISFDLNAGETLGLVGESGSGKSMIGLSILRLAPQPVAKIVGGQMLFRGRDLLHLTNEEMRRLRGTQIAMILQDPMTALNPVFTIGYQVGEGIRIHRGWKGRRLANEVTRLLHEVRIPGGEHRKRAYPHQMSGGMRQRIVIAMSVANEPDLIIADEPTSSLDVTTQLSILKTLKDLQLQKKTAMILITHDFGVVNRTCDHVAVMYAGKLMETGPVRSVMKSPAHPYTIGLLNCIPGLRTELSRLNSIEGQPPDLRSFFPGCRFASRCARASDICRDQPPPEISVGSGHVAYCWHV